MAGPVIEIQAVVEVSGQRDFTAWAVASGPEYGYLRLSDRMAKDEVGSVMATIANCIHLLEPENEGECGNRSRNNGKGAGGESAARSAEARVEADLAPETILSRLLAAEAVIAPGGLWVRDAESGVVLSPGCCSGLESWREDWFGILKGREPWLGHDPTPGIGIMERSVRLRPDAGKPGPIIEIALAELAGMLAGVQRDLDGFLAVTRNWAEELAQGMGDAVVAVLDRDFAVNVPMPPMPMPMPPTG